MSSEIRVNKITNRIGLSTVTFADSGIGVTVTGRIDPDTDSARDLGTTSVRWRNVYADTFSGSGASLTNIPAGNLTGTVADARISSLTASKLTGALPAIDGSNLTGISAGVSLANGANNRVVTATGANAITGESTLTFDGSTLAVTGSQNAYLSNNILKFDRAGYSYIDQVNNAGSLVFRVTSSNTNALRLDSSAQAIFGGTLYVPGDIVHDGDTDTKIKFNNNEIDFEAAGSSRLKVTQYATYVQAGHPFAFLATSGSSPNIKSGGTNNQDLLFTSGSGNPTRLQIASNGQSTFKEKLIVDYTVSGSDYIAKFINQNANCYGVWISTPSSANAGYPLLAVTNASGGSHFRVDSGGLVYANSGTGTEKPAYFVRAWVQGTGGGGTNGSGGLSSMQRISTGNFQLNFATTMPDDNYAVGCLADNNYSDTSWFNVNETGRVRVYFYSNGSYQNPSEWSAWVIR
tara:strand:- start:1165 stop:2547 length:1383 start_codon:yes stop_codon:yes gene_type:complete